MITDEVPEGQGAYKAHPGSYAGQAAWLASESPEADTRTPALTPDTTLLPATSALLLSYSSCFAAHSVRTFRTSRKSRFNLLLPPTACALCKEPDKWQVQTQKLNHRQSHPLTKPSWPALWHIQPQKTAIHEGLMTNVNTKSLNEPPPRTTWQEYSLRFSKPQGLPTTLTEHSRKSWQFPTRSPPAKYRSTADKGA